MSSTFVVDNHRNGAKKTTLYQSAQISIVHYYLFLGKPRYATTRLWPFLLFTITSFQQTLIRPSYFKEVTVAPKLIGEQPYTKKSSFYSSQESLPNKSLTNPNKVPTFLYVRNLISSFKNLDKPQQGPNHFSFSQLSSCQQTVFEIGEVRMTS